MAFSSDRVLSILESALERPVEERSSFVHDECGEDAELLAAVESQLASYTGFDSFLEAPIVSALGDATPTISEPAMARASTPSRPDTIDQHQRLGPYRILKNLGEGGMGVVYLAEQTEPIRRRVALKVIRSSLVEREVIRRFEAERQALARTNHPHIAQAYEAGETEGGQPYFAMEYVQGLPITRYCDEKQLTIDQRLRLFLQVCDGVHHLHQKGLIHRDIKPSNILVAEEQDQPVPKIIDFGIAKALDQPLTDGTVFTGDRLIGTPSYLSPEAIQASRGGFDVDTRSDVYALGVLLYELLSGMLPLEMRGEGFFEVARRILQDEPPLASVRFTEQDRREQKAIAEARRLEPKALNRRLRGDLDWIVNKAIEKDRARRYGSAPEMAEDVKRHLRHEPVTASPPNAAYRLRKFVRRHRSFVTTGLLLTLALVGGITARTLEANRANREAARANEEAQRANQEAEAAQKVADFLVDLFEVSNPDNSQPGSMTARELLDRGAESLLASDLEDQPLLQSRLMDTVGNAYLNLGVDEPAFELLHRSSEVLRSVLGDEDLAVAQSIRNLGRVHMYRSHYDEALRLWEQSLEMTEKILGPDHLEVALSLNNLGSAYSHQGRFDLAEPYLKRSLAIRKEQLKPGDPTLGTGYFSLGVFYYHRGDLNRSKPLFEQALAHYEEAFGPDHGRVATTLSNLGVLAFESGDYEEAASLHTRALEFYQERLEPDHSEIARSSSNLAETLWMQGKGGEAEKYFQRAREIWERTGGRDSIDLAHALLGLANLYRDQGRLAEAEPLYLRALAIRKGGLSPDHPDLLKTKVAYAEQLRATGREAEAARLEASEKASRDE